MRDEWLESWLTQEGLGAITHRETLSGGCISTVSRITLRDGRSLILKTHPNPPPGLFRAEAAGLKALRGRDALRVPAVHYQGEQALLLEDLGEGSPGSDYWSSFGQSLAALHEQTQTHFGFTETTFCGPTAQDNQRESDGCRFFAHRRLYPLIQANRERGHLQSPDCRRLERIADRLSEWLPPMPPVLIHGDLWSGNLHCDSEGHAALIDPAAYWGWAEAELAMTTLFGRLPQTCYDAYLENSTVAPDWETRAPLYNLYHLLNHLLLFGGSYLQAVQTIARRYGDSPVRTVS